MNNTNINEKMTKIEENSINVIFSEINTLKNKYNHNVIAKYINYVIYGDCESKYTNKLKKLIFQYIINIHTYQVDTYQVDTYEVDTETNNISYDCDYGCEDENLGVKNTNKEYVIWKLKELLHEMLVVRNELQKNITNVESLIKPEPNFNIKHKNQKGLEVYGLERVRHIHDIIEPYHDSESENILDIFLEETFLINKEVYEILEILPYRKKWYGILQYNKPLDIAKILSSSVFLESLKYCKGLITFFTSIKQYLDFFISEKCLNIKVIQMNIPIKELSSPFDIKKFMDNKKIIGSHLDKSFYFYNTDVVYTHSGFFKKHDTCIKKILYSSSMPSDDIKTDIKNIMKKKNGWSIGLILHLDEIINSMTIVNHDEYYSLLSESVVYLENPEITVFLECILQNVPVIIKKYKDIVKILGEKYPLYQEGNNLKLTKNKIIKAHKYLMEFNKNNKKVHNSDLFIGKLSSFINN